MNLALSSSSHSCAYSALLLASVNSREMNFYFNAVAILDKLDKKQDSIKGLLSSVPEKDRKRTTALVIETLKCTSMFVTSWFDALSGVGPSEPQIGPS